MNHLKFRYATIDDLNLLSILSITTNYEAYFQLDPSRDLADYCLRMFNLEQVKSEFEDENSTFIIAELKGNAVGFAKLREGKKISCMGGKIAIEIQRIYLLEKMKGMNLGRELINHCFEIGKAKGYQAVWLGVWDQNIRAQNFYQKNGMKEVGEIDFSDGKNTFINLVMAKDL